MVSVKQKPIKGPRNEKPNNNFKKEKLKGKVQKNKTKVLANSKSIIQKVKKELKKEIPGKPKKEIPVEPVKKNIIQKKVRHVMPSKYITENIVVNSLKALQELTTHYQKKNSLLEDEFPIFAEFNCIKIQNTTGNIKFVFPHSTFASTAEVCLITKDLKKGKKVDHEPTIEHWEELLRTAGVTNVKTVLPMRQLRVEYDQFELKRRLLTQHDFIMVDTRVLNHVSHILGKMFFKKHNMLVPVRINEKGNIKSDIDVGIRTAMLRLSEGATSTVVVGHTGMSQEHLKENIISLVKQLNTKYPGGELNVRSIHIKLPLSLSLPLYITLRSSNVLHAPKLKQKKPKHCSDVEGELSTMPGSTVRVAPDGRIRLKKGTLESSSEDENSAEDEPKGEVEEGKESDS